MTVVTRGFDRAVAIVLEREGVFSADPRDDGGATKYGISARSYPDLDIAGLAVEQAIELYRRDYWERCRCAELPWPLALALFDGAVNQGAVPATRCLQQALGVSADGAVGPATVRAARDAPQRQVLARFLARRALRYARHPDWRIYGKGWMTRLFVIQQACLT